MYEKQGTPPCGAVSAFASLRNDFSVVEKSPQVVLLVENLRFIC